MFKMPILRNILRNVLSDTSDCCCLCFNVIEENETTYNVKDEVCLGIKIEATEVLYEMISVVLGDKVLDSISAYSIICQKCTGMLINCFKFIQQCKHNIEQLHCTIDSLQKHTQESVDNYDFKSLFVALDTSNYNVELYYDKQRNCKDQTLLHKKFQRIYKASHNLINDLEVESNHGADNKMKNAVKRKESSILKSIVLADIVHDKDDLSNLKCKTCLKIYPSVKKIKHHYLNVHAPKDFKCSLCPRSYGSSLLLSTHEKYSHYNGICSQCGKTFTSIYSLKKHERLHSLLRLACHTCGKVCKGKQALNNHIKKKLCYKKRKSNAEAKLCCSYCGKRYSWKAGLNAHIRVQHENGYAVICDWCGKKFSSMSHLKDHIVTHTKQKDFECAHCGGRFVSRMSLLYHTRTHTGEKPYKCEFCDRTFLSASRRSEHVKREHTQSNIECDICLGRFKGSKNLAQHRKKHFDKKSRLYSGPSASVVS